MSLGLNVYLYLEHNTSRPCVDTATCTVLIGTAASDNVDSKRPPAEKGGTLTPGSTGRIAVLIPRNIPLEDEPHERIKDV